MLVLSKAELLVTHALLLFQSTVLPKPTNMQLPSHSAALSVQRKRPPDRFSLDACKYTPPPIAALLLVTFSPLKVAWLFSADKAPPLRGYFDVELS
jgi:hypothetical protein